MTESITQTPADDPNRTDEHHPFDYYYRAGMNLRPTPPRAVFSEIWTPAREPLAQWMDFREIPADTPLTALWADHMWQGDELMDAFVARCQQIGMANGRQLLDAALDDGIDSIDSPPTELAALFEHLDNPPGWHDAELWERGRQLWNNASFAGKLGMFVQDTMGTFVGDEVAAATGATGRFVHDPLRRNLETTLWFRNMTYKNALDRFADPFKDTVRVRLMHSQVRAGLRRSWGDGHFAQHGNPISNATMMGAAVSFGLLPLIVDHRHGRRCTQEDLDAVMAYWSYIAHVFGVAEELIPKSSSDGIAMMDFMVATAGGPSAWTETMLNAATAGVGQGVIGRLKRAALTPLVGMMAYYSGEPLARALFQSTGLDGVHLAPWIAITRALVFANIGVRRILDQLPDAMQRTSTKHDRFWQIQVVLAKFLAARAGIRDATYDHHNATPETSAAVRSAKNAPIDNKHAGEPAVFEVDRTARGPSRIQSGSRLNRDLRRPGETSL